MRSALLTFFVLAIPVIAQNQLERTVVSSGGGDSTGGTYTGTFTIGQPAAGGFLTGTPNQAYAGFWTPPTLAPTAAGVTVSGRVMDPNGRGMSSAVLTLTDPNGTIRRAQTNTFGYFRFTEVAAGWTYIISVSSRRYTFPESTQMISVIDTVSGINFYAARP